MADESATAGSFPLCPWCSAPLDGGDGATCPSCGARVVGEADTDIPGVTSIDAVAAIRAARSTTPKRRSRLLSWISGDQGDEEFTAAPSTSVAPPDPAVRREMLRLELAALEAAAAADHEAAVSAAVRVPAAADDAPPPDDPGEPSKDEHEQASPPGSIRG